MIYMKQSVKTKEQIEAKILELSKINKVGGAGTTNRAWIDALHWVSE